MAYGKTSAVSTACLLSFLVIAACLTGKKWPHSIRWASKHYQVVIKKRQMSVCEYLSSLNVCFAHVQYTFKYKSVDVKVLETLRKSFNTRALMRLPSRISQKKKKMTPQQKLKTDHPSFCILPPNNYKTEHLNIGQFALSSAAPAFGRSVA